MKHKTCRDNLSAYLDGEMREDEREALEIHLDSCEECRAELQELKALSGLLKKHAMEPVPPSLREAVLGKRGTSIHWLKPALVFSGAAAALLVTYNLTRPDAGSHPRPGPGSPPGAAAPVLALPEHAAGEKAAQPPEARRSSSPGLVSGKKTDVTSGELQAVREAPETSPPPAVGGRGEAYGEPAEVPEDAGPGAAAGPQTVETSLQSEVTGQAKPLSAARGRAQALPEFSGPVSVLVGDPTLVNESDPRIHEALLFLEKAGARLARSEPGLLIFVKKNGSRKLVREKDCPLGFVLFNGVRNPLIVRDPAALPDAYRRYFGAE